MRQEQTKMKKNQDSKEKLFPALSYTVRMAHVGYRGNKKNFK